jgi:hypothetical protein
VLGSGTQSRRMAFLSPGTLDVDLAPNQIRLRLGSRTLAISPTLWLGALPDRRNTPQRLLAAVHGIGDAPPLATAATAIRLFDPASRVPPQLSKSDCLALFFTKAVRTLMAPYVLRASSRCTCKASTRLPPVRGLPPRAYLAGSSACGGP